MNDVKIKCPPRILHHIIHPSSSTMPQNDTTKLLIAVFRQWKGCRIDTNRLGTDLGIRPGAAGMRLVRLRERLATDATLRNADRELLIAILRQENRFPRINYHRLGADLEILPGAASMRWIRFKARLEIRRNRPQRRGREAQAQENSVGMHGMSEPAGNVVAPGHGNGSDSQVIRWPYRSYEASWLDDEA